MDPLKIQSIVRRYLWLFVLAPLIASLTTFFVLGNEPASYRASTRLLVGPSLESPSLDVNSLKIGGQLVQTYAELAQTRSFLESVNNKLEQKTSIDSLNSMITTRENIETRILTIIVYHPDPSQAVAIAKAAAETYIEMSPSQDNITALVRAGMSDQAQQLEKIVNKSEKTIKKLETELDKLKSAKSQRSSNLQRQNLITRQLADERSYWADSLRSLATIYQMLLDTNTNQLEIVEPAGAAFLVNQELPLRVFGAAVGGLILAILIAFAFEYFNDSIRSPQDLSRTAQVRLLSKVEKHDRLGGPDLRGLSRLPSPHRALPIATGQQFPNYFWPPGNRFLVLSS
jgi:succinoglycan biosynthesis transport protein ExoP